MDDLQRYKTKGLALEEIDMLAELPKIFDKNFALNYFFPSLVFIVLSRYLFQKAGLTQVTLPYLKGELVNDVSVVALFSYLGAIILLAINKELYRFLEGYGIFNPFRLVGKYELERFRRIRQEITSLNEMYKNPSLMPVRMEKRAQLLHQISNRFPDQDGFVLPTPFGNIIRAIEIYPSVMYGIDYSTGWIRLQAVMPNEYRVLVDEAKTGLDLWVNMQFLSTILVIQSGWLFLSTEQFPLLILAFTFFILNIFFMGQANSYATQWGEYVKSAFDMFIPKMREVLSIPTNMHREEEKLYWLRFSQAIIYRQPHLIPKIREDTKVSKTNIRKRTFRKR